MGSSCRYDCMCTQIAFSYFLISCFIPGATIADIFNTASTPGLSFPPNLALKPFNKPRIPNLSSTGRSHVTNSEHLLHTSAHPTIDYIGREEEGGGTDGLLSHYIGVYDPQSGGLQLMRARKLVLRRCLRATPTQVEQEAEAANVSRTTFLVAFSLCKSEAERPYRISQHAPRLD